MTNISLVKYLQGVLGKGYNVKIKDLKIVKIKYANCQEIRSKVETLWLKRQNRIFLS
jgi:invasion protein IalB